jgi:ankyrin repeat protein
MVDTNISPSWFDAAYQGDCDALKDLLQQGVNINNWQVFSPHYGMTALHHAARNIHLDCVRLLVSSGADVNADYDPQPGWCGWTPLMCAVEAQEGGDLEESVSAVEIVRLLLENGASPNIRYVSTVLEIAEANGYDNIARLLRKAGARE